MIEKILKDIPKNVQVIGVTKSLEEKQIKQIIKSGIYNLAENRLENLIEKQKMSYNRDIVWHFVGNIQTKKIKNIVNKVSYIHSLENIKQAKEIQKHTMKPIKCFIQVNTTINIEDTKHGVKPTKLLEFIKELNVFENIEIVGLMTIAANITNEQIVRKSFFDLKKMQLEIQKLELSYAPCLELSMGMSQDYKIAIEEGATMIRLGKIFSN